MSEVTDIAITLIFTHYIQVLKCDADPINMYMYYMFIKIKNIFLKVFLF
jgi:hypothetical protein